MTRFEEGLALFRQTPGALLLDVRSREEYDQGHIPGSILLSNIDDILDTGAMPDTPLYLYCRSGARSSRAAAQLADMGYEDITNLSGLTDYHGELEK